MTQPAPLLLHSEPINLRQDISTPVSALRICIGRLEASHVGRKVRIYGRCVSVSKTFAKYADESSRILQYDVRHSLLYLRDDLLPLINPTDDSEEWEPRQATVVVDCKTVLIADRHGHQDASEDMITAAIKRKQPTFRFQPGEGFCVVGWIERVVDEVC
jgi:hypothetical protein